MKSRSIPMRDSNMEYVRQAENIEWAKDRVNANDLWRNYIIHEHDSDSDKYFAAIVCRYWGYVHKNYQFFHGHVPIEQCYDVYMDTIYYTLRKRVWENQDSSLFNVKEGPDIAFHKNLLRQRSIFLKSENAQKRIANFNALSIDSYHDEYNDSSDGMLFNLESSEQELTLVCLIKQLAEEDVINAFIVDIICYYIHDNDDEPGMVIKRVVKRLKHLDKNYIDQFRVTYDYNNILRLNKARYDVVNSSTRALEIKIKSLLYRLKKEKIHG